MIRLSPPWGSRKNNKNKHIFFFENCKKNISFYHFVDFLSKSKILHANSPDRAKMLFYQALALQIRGAPIKKRGFVPIFLWSPSEHDSCKMRKYKL